VGNLGAVIRGCVRLVPATLVHREPLPKTIAIHRRTRRLSRRRPALVVLHELTGGRKDL